MDVGCDYSADCLVIPLILLTIPSSSRVLVYGEALSVVSAYQLDVLTTVRGDREFSPLSTMIQPHERVMLLSSFDLSSWVDRLCLVDGETTLLVLNPPLAEAG